MKTIAKLAGLVVLLNVVRYTVGGFLEGFTIMEPMHRPLPLFPEAFDSSSMGSVGAPVSAYAN